MPWKGTSIMDQRQEFVMKSLKAEKPFRKLCEEYGISEKTGYKWKNRFMEEGTNGLIDMSKRPRNSPTQLGEDIIIEIIKIREAHPSWGPKKIQAIIDRNGKHPLVPSISSIKRILDKAELTRKIKIRKVDTGSSRLHQLIPANEPNDVWAIDFKGYWYSNGEKIIPFTVRDLFSRKILAIETVSTTSAECVRSILTDLFKKYGLPKVIRSDNGEPFASSASKLGLTKLSAWLITLGITPDRTKPGTPGQNGSLERMHADMARELEHKIPGGRSANQAGFDIWKDEYNSLRPNEAIGMKVPDDLYSPSPRPYLGDPDIIEYPPFVFPRLVSHTGLIIINGHRVFISTALSGLHLGLQPLSDFSFLVWLADFPIGILHTDTDSFDYDIQSLSLPSALVSGEAA